MKGIKTIPAAKKHGCFPLTSFPLLLDWKKRRAAQLHTGKLLHELRHWREYSHCRTSGIEEDDGILEGLLVSILV